MGELLALAVCCIVSVVGGIVWGYRVGRAAEQADWVAGSARLDLGGSHITRFDTDFVVMPRGYFWTEYHNPLVRARSGR